MTDPLRDGNDLPALARRLERERDEARAELARLKANNRYQRGYHDGEQAAREELKTPTPPTEGSAVEWNAEKWHSIITRDPCKATSAAHHLSIECAELQEDVANLRTQLAGEQAAREELKTPTPPTEGSSVEWAIKQWAGWVAGKGGSIMQDIIMPLARRCDEAEFWAKSWKASHDNQVRLKRALVDRPDLKERAASWKKLNDDNEALRARLAAALAKKSA